jgi:hypothetical protein
MNIIDPFYLYLILQLDSIKAFIETIGVLSLVGVLVASFSLLIRGSSARDTAKIYADDDSRLYKQRHAAETATAESSFRLMWKAVRISPIPLLLLAVNAFLPTSERMAALVVLPAVANNAHIQEEASEVYELAKKGLERLVTGDEAAEPAK